MQEIWKDIPNYENLYQISNMGNVKRFYAKSKTIRYIKGCPNSKGYLIISLCKNNTQKSFTVHRLVAELFIPNPLNLPCINHIDEDKTNNNVTNLEWCTYQYNNTYGHRIENSVNTRRKNHGHKYQ